MFDVGDYSQKDLTLGILGTVSPQNVCPICIDKELSLQGEAALEVVKDYKKWLRKEVKTNG